MKQIFRDEKSPTNDENLPHPPSPSMGEGEGGGEYRLISPHLNPPPQVGRRFSGDIFFVFMWILFLPLILVILGFGCKKSPPLDRCDYDGVKIESLYGVYFTLQDGTEKKFCSIACASMSFPELKSRIKEVHVVDERLGTKINASQAHFVESEVVTVPHVKNRIHVFAKKEDGLKHIQKFRGNWLGNPFSL
jgi:hypothetical protein